jgi:hypothetical protein
MLCRLLRTVAAAFAVVVLVAGCYTTKVIASPTSSAQIHEDRQWFTIGGLAPLSEPAGSQCGGGIASAVSQYSVVDMLIGIGLGFAGGLAGGLACGSTSSQGGCISLGASLLPFLFSSRTVWYQCLGGERIAPAD